MFTKSEKGAGKLIDSKLVFKAIHRSSSGGCIAREIVVDISALSDYKSEGNPNPKDLYGGLLVGVSTPLQSSLRKDSTRGREGQKSVSKIEADAIAQQQLELKKETEKDRAGEVKKSRSAPVESVVANAETAWDEGVGGGGEYLKSSWKFRFYVMASKKDTKAGMGTNSKGNQPSSTRFGLGLGLVS
jgi:hypothetical protein